MTDTESLTAGTDTTAAGRPPLHVEQHAGVSVLRWDRGKVNALDLELLTAIADTMAAVGPEPVVLTGAGSSFSAGVDLRRIVTDDAEHTEAFLAALDRALLAVFRHPRPVVAAINGHAIAGGCVLALAADVRLMSGGTIGLTELRVGVPFPTVALEIVRYAAGPAAHLLALGADLHEPERAQALGLVHAVATRQGLLPEAIEWAGRLAAIDPTAYALTKAQLQTAAEARIAERTAVDDAEVRRRWCSSEGRAAIGAFLDGLDRAGARRG